MSARRLMVSGIGKRNHLLRLLIQECSRLDVEVVGADADECPPARGELVEFRRLPRATEPQFAQAYRRVAIDTGAEAALTLIDPEIPIVANLEGSGLLGRASFLHPDEEVSRLCEDKLAFAERLANSGILGVPTSLDPPSRGPYIRKERRGSAGSGYRFFDEDSSAGSTSNETEEMVFQPFISGQHYCVDAYFSMNDGRLVDLGAKAVLAKSRGESYLLRSASAGRFADLVELVGTVLPLRGIVNLDIYDTPAGLALMEINCRIGGNYPASHSFGVNLIRPMLDEVFGGGLAEVEASSYSEGLLVSKYFAFTEPYELKTDEPHDDVDAVAPRPTSESH